MLLVTVHHVGAFSQEVLHQEGGRAGVERHPGVRGEGEGGAEHALVDGGGGQDVGEHVGVCEGTVGLCRDVSLKLSCETIRHIEGLSLKFEHL